MPSSWCRKLYLVPLSAQTVAASRPSHSGPEQSRAARKNNNNKPSDQRIQAGHTLELCHGHTHTHTAESRHRKQQRGRHCNHADDIHLIMTFHQQAWGIMQHATTKSSLSRLHSSDTGFLRDPNHRFDPVLGLWSSIAFISSHHFSICVKSI